MGVERSALEAHVEAHGAALALLRLVLHPLRAREPVVGVVVRVHERHPELLREADVLALPQLVFLLRVDVRVVEEDRVLDARRQHRLHHFARARRAAGVQENLPMATRKGQRCAGVVAHAAILSPLWAMGYGRWVPGYGR